MFTSKTTEFIAFINKKFETILDEKTLKSTYFRLLGQLDIYRKFEICPENDLDVCGNMIESIYHQKLNGLES